MFDVTLTFDNGPEPSVTPLVLDVLATHGVLSTFFVIGSKLEQPAGRSCAERAYAEGHWVGNHTWTHSCPLGEQPGEAAAEREIRQTQRTIGQLSRSPPLFRPMGAGGNLDGRLLSAAAAAVLQEDNYSCVLWNAIPRDWAEPDEWVEIALAQIASRPWTLMVLHDLPTGAMRHLDRFLHEIRYRNGNIRQDFPMECMPIVAGRSTHDLAKYISKS